MAGVTQDAVWLDRFCCPGPPCPALEVPAGRRWPAGHRGNPRPAPYSQNMSSSDLLLHGPQSRTASAVCGSCASLGQNAEGINSAGEAESVYGPFADTEMWGQHEGAELLAVGARKQSVSSSEDSSSTQTHGAMRSAPSPSFHSQGPTTDRKLPRHQLSTCRGLGPCPAALMSLHEQCRGHLRHCQQNLGRTADDKDQCAQEGWAAASQSQGLWLAPCHSPVDALLCSRSSPYPGNLHLGCAVR